MTTFNKEDAREKFLKEYPNFKFYSLKQLRIKKRKEKRRAEHLKLLDEIVTLRFVNRLKLREIATRKGVSHQRISQIIKTAVLKESNKVDA